MTSPVEPTRVALQLYTVRAMAERDLLATLANVASLGYDGVELAGLHGRRPDEVRAACDVLGVEICGAHVSVERFEGDPHSVARELRALGLHQIVFPTLPVGGGDPELAGVERLHRAAGHALELGLDPVFHNHDVELRRAADGTRPWERLLELPELGLELDLGWAWVAGEDPTRLLASVADRVAMVHVKDHVTSVAGTPDCPVGDGEVGYESVIPAAVAAGVRWLIVEQDEPGDDPLAAAGRSLEALRRLVATASPGRSGHAL